MNELQSWPGLFFSQWPDLRFEWVTPEMARFLGVTARSLKGSPDRFWSFVHPADREALRKEFEFGADWDVAAPEDGRTPAAFRKGIRFGAKLGQWKTHAFRVRLRPMERVAYISECRRPRLDPSGKVCGYDGFWTDMTRQTLAEQRLLLAGWKATLADLTPGLAHDFNNALTGILGLSEAYLAQIDAKHSFHDGLRIIQHKAREASELIQRIARLYQEKTGSRSYHDANSMVAEVWEILSKVISKRIEVSAKYAADSLPVYLDAVEFRRVLLGLAFSAVNAMPGQGKLHLRASRRDTPPEPRHLLGKMPRQPLICVSIMNSGPGFKINQRDGVCGPFAPPGETMEGSDPPLHHARLFVERSSGAISVESRPKVQTTFSLWLPQADFTEAEECSSV